MKIWVCSSWKNEKALAGFFLRHYSRFADEIHVYDDSSDDGTRDIVRSCPIATLHDFPTEGLDEEANLALAHRVLRHAEGRADWVVWVDADEFVWCPDMRGALQKRQEKGYSVARTLGFNMMNGELPSDDGVSQITDIFRTGVRGPIYSKSCIVRPSANIVWDRGKHKILKCDGLVEPWDAAHDYESDAGRIKLLHYRYLNEEYCRQRNARQYARAKDVGVAWTCAPTWEGEHSESWVSRTKHLARDVVAEDACYLHPPHDA